MKDIKKYSKKRAIEKEVKEVIATTEIMSSKTRSGKSPKKASSVSVISEAPLKKKGLRKLVEIEEEEEEEAGVSLIRKKKDADDTAHKSTIEPTLKCAQLLALVILD